MKAISRSIQLKYIFPAGGLLKSSPNTFVKEKVRKVNQKPVIFAALEGALCRASLDKVILLPNRDFSDSSDAFSCVIF